MSKSLKILKVIHGFPPDYMAGSEVYSYNLCKELQKQGCEVFVFTRVENEFDAPYSIYREVIDNIPIYRVNKRKDYSYKDKFYDEKLENIFLSYLKTINPDIIHFGHVCHLSVNLLKIAKELDKKIIFTIHDFWLFCLKGQLINEKNEICPTPSLENCQKCSPYKPPLKEVEQIFRDLHTLISKIDLFLAPSHTLRDFFLKQGVPSSKVIYQKYGFNREIITYRKRVFKEHSKVRFAFMGRVIPTKGIKVLIEAFRQLPNEKLKIYGSIGAQKRFLQTDNVEFMGGYDNGDIDRILQNVDVLIVPSIWLENSPLVIQEAFLAGVIVITSNIGGMRELIGENEGFLFEVGDSYALANCIKKICKNPTILNTIKDNRHKVCSIQEDTQKIVSYYHKLLENTPINLKRITIDTNPNTCNFKCIMCDTHSIYNNTPKNCRPDMPLELLKKTMQQAKEAGVSEIIPTTMGEPMLYKHFKDIVDFCKHNHIKLNLTTNGSQFFNHRYDENYIINHLLAVLSDVKISFNSLDSTINESIMRQTNTKVILQTINRLIDLRNQYAKNVSITLQMTFMKSNMDSIQPLIEYAIDKGVNRIKGHQLWITHKQLESEAIHKDKKAIAKWNALVQSLEIYRNKIKLENFTLLQSNTRKENSKECPFLGRELWVNYRGDVNVCCAPDTLRKSLGDFSNVEKDSLLDILASKNYQNLMANYKNMEVCKQCLLRK